jgi:hypothetical protein
MQNSWTSVGQWWRAFVHTRLTALTGPRTGRGQATVEYVLVLIGVAAIALLVAAWAASTGKIGALLDRVFDSMSARVS